MFACIGNGLDSCGVCPVPSLFLLPLETVADLGEEDIFLTLSPQSTKDSISEYEICGTMGTVLAAVCMSWFAHCSFVLPVPCRPCFSRTSRAVPSLQTKTGQQCTDHLDAHVELFCQTAGVKEDHAFLCHSVTPSYLSVIFLKMEMMLVFVKCLSCRTHNSSNSTALELGNQ